MKHLSDSELMAQTREIAKKERELSAELLLHLKEISDRKLYAVDGFGGMFDFMTRGLGYSEAAAQRRIASVQVLSELPEVETQIRSGTLNISNIAQAQRFFKLEAKVKKPLTSSQKRDLLKKIEKKSTREVERELLNRSSHPQRLRRPDRIRPARGGNSVVSFLASEELIAQMEEIRGLLAHSMPNASFDEIFQRMADISLESLRKKKFKLKEKRPTPAPESAPVNEAPAATPSRYIPAEIRRSVAERDRFRCSYTSPKTGRRCISLYALETDHLKSFGIGGETSKTNLGLRCREHNQRHAIETYGREKMEKWRKSPP